MFIFSPDVVVEHEAPAMTSGGRAVSEGGSGPVPVASASGSEAPVHQGGLRLPPRPPRSSRGCQRWAGAGCLAGMILVVAAVVGSVLLMQNGVRWAVERAHNRLDHRLAEDVGDAVGEPVRSRLEAFVTSLKESGDPIPVMGEFLRRASEALEDDRLTEGEVGSLDEFLRDAIASTPDQGVEKP